MDNRKTGSNFNLLSRVETSIELSALFLIVEPFNGPIVYYVPGGGGEGFGGGGGTIFEKG